MAKTTNKGPRISINKLAEFITSKGARQRQILRDQKFPPDFKRMYYKESGEAIAQAISSNLEDLSSITKTRLVLEQQTPDKVGTQRRIDANLDALDTFDSMLDKIDLKNAVPRLGDHAPPLLTMFGVEISVRPEIILCSKGKSGKPLVGAVKLHFPRTFALNADSAGYVSAVVQEWCNQNLYDEGATNGTLCPVIDIGSQAVYDGVKSTTARMKDVEAECQNIAALWPTIEL